MKPLFACAAALALSLVPGHSLFAETEHETEGPDDNGGVPQIVRARHDVSCSLRVTDGAVVTPGTSVPAKFVVRNKSRKAERGITMSVFADVPYGTPLWTGTVSLRGHRRTTKHLSIQVPAGATSLVAVATCDGDENPGNNLDGVEVEHEDGDDDGGTVTPPPAPAPSAAVLAGAATFATNCASCHGSLGEGGTSHERVAGKSAHSLYEAMQEGEDDMPRFPNMTWTDAQNLTAYLANPSAATPTTPPVTPPSGTTPTYAADIKPYLATNCTVCHTGANSPASIRLDSYATASANGAAALSAIAGLRMPPGNPQTAAAIQLFTDWVNGGKPQ